MAEIIPIKGIRYADKKVGHLDRVITPPYDVISPKEQQQLYERSPYNIIRLEKPRQEPGDHGEDKYIRARDQYRLWLQDGVLQAEEKPVLYFYEEEFGGEGGRKTRQGLICGVKLIPYEEKVVLPHEETMAKPKEDRLKLMRACKANFSPIFSLYAAKEDPLPSLLAPLRQGPAVIDFRDSLGHSHRVWAIEDEEIIEKVTARFKDRQIFIADGHHRYETALDYHRELGSPQGPAAYVMMTLMNIYDPGLVVLPTHRMVKGMDPFKLESLLASLGEGFVVEQFPYSAEDVCTKGLQGLKEAGKEGPAFGLFAGDNKFFLLRAKGRERLPVDGKLDTTVLQEEILERILGIDAQKRFQGDYLTYARDCKEAVSGVLKGTCQVSFLVNPTPAEAVLQAAAAGSKMPQKSTFFYPKLVAGLVINPLE